MSNTPFSQRRWRDDLVAARPAVGMIVGASAGLVLGTVLCVVLRRG